MSNSILNSVLSAVGLAPAPPAETPVPPASSAAAATPDAVPASTGSLAVPPVVKATPGLNSDLPNL